nr:endonuclease/exonuclease/phosphatase family protein [Mycolicibacterium sediminis]
MFRWIGTVLGAGALVAACLGLAVRYLPVTDHVMVILTSASPYLMLAAPVAVVLLALSRRWVPVVLAVVAMLVVVAVRIPLYTGPETRQAQTTPVRVMTANLGMGRADARATAATARDLADVLVVQEMTPEAQAGLSATGVDRDFPYRVVDPRDVASGIGVWSRHPIVESAPVDGYAMPMLEVRLRVPGVAFDPTVLAVHLAAPWPAPIDAWRRDVERLPATLRTLALDAGSGAVIVAGDLNATVDMLPFRRLLDNGYRDAAEQAGAGMSRTFPGQRRVPPPLLGIDHVLVRLSSASSLQRVPLPGSDHMGLVVGVDVPLNPTVS